MHAPRTTNTHSIFYNVEFNHQACKICEIRGIFVNANSVDVALRMEHAKQAGQSYKHKKRGDFSLRSLYIQSTSKAFNDVLCLHRYDSISCLFLALCQNNLKKKSILHLSQTHQSHFFFVIFICDYSWKLKILIRLFNS